MNSHVYFCLFLYLVSFYIGVLCVAQNETESFIDEDELAVQRWKDTFGKMKKLIGVGIKTAMPYVMNSLSDRNFNLSTQCSRALFQWISDAKNMKPWALRMGDASAKMIDGILTGSFSSFGSFDQCVNTINPKGTLQGKYCRLEFWPVLPPKPRFYALNQRLSVFKQFENDTGVMGEFTKYVQLFYMFPLRLGICLPSPCSEEDLSNMVSHAVKQYFTFNVSVPHCEIKEPLKIEYSQLAMFGVIALLFLLVTTGTLYDLLVYRKRKARESTKDMGVLSDCLMAFSAAENWKKLFDLEAGAESLEVFHGIRFFSMCWIILGHTYFHLNFNILRDLQITIELTSQFVFNTVTNATLVVDNFFFLSGVLYVFVTMDLMKIMGKVPRAIYFVIHRFWRFLPIQAFFVGCSTLLPLLGSGPIWHENIDPIVEGCKKDWWANLIFINNFYRSTEKGCLSYSWYLAADFQVYVFCIPIVILIIRKPRIGLSLNFVAMLLSITAVAVHNYYRDLPPTLLFTRADEQQRTELMRETYYTPFPHLAPFCIGLFIGYYLQQSKGPLQMHWSFLTIAWLGAFTMTSAALFGVHPWNQGFELTGKIPTLLYASLSRIGWTLGLAWITVACTKGCGGVLARLLRSKAFAPFGRLTFLVYMVHPLVQYVFYACLRDGIQAMNHLAIFICLGFIVASYFFALLLSLLLESPFISLGMVIFKRRESAKKRQKTLFFTNDKKSTDRKTRNMPQMADSNGKCNGAFDSSTEVTNGVTISVEANRTSTDDTVCHL